MPDAPPTSPSSDADSPPERNQRLLLVLGALAVVSAVIAGVVIFSSSGSTPAKEPVAQVRTSGGALVEGRASAPRKIEVYDDFGDPASREFEIASRDFLEVEAAQGHVLVEHHPYSVTAGYSRQALEAWAAVVGHGSATQAKVFHDELFDRQPADQSAAPTPAELEAWADQVGVDKGVVSEALASPDSAFFDSARASARAAGIEQPPTVLVDGSTLGRGTGIELADQLQRRILDG
jgi:protein-disulfide isomerase